jgi:hypothetical protein
MDRAMRYSKSLTGSLGDGRAKRPIPKHIVSTKKPVYGNHKVNKTHTNV